MPPRSGVLRLLQAEPGENSSTSTTGGYATANYTLTVWGLMPGATYTTFRLPDRFKSECDVLCAWLPRLKCQAVISARAVFSLSSQP